MQRSTGDSFFLHPPPHTRVLCPPRGSYILHLKLAQSSPHASLGDISVCDVTPHAQVRIAFISSSGPQTVPAFPALYGGLLPDSASTPLKLALADPPQACNITGDPRKWAGRAVLAVRGGCSFTQKARVAQAGNATLLVLYNDASGIAPQD